MPFNVGPVLARAACFFEFPSEPAEFNASNIIRDEASMLEFENPDEGSKIERQQRLCRPFEPPDDGSDGESVISTTFHMVISPRCGVRSGGGWPEK